MRNIDHFGRHLLAAIAIASASPGFAAVSTVTAGFDGHNQRRAIALGDGFIPADPAGAVGTSQFASITNGGFAVYTKAGTELLVQDSDTFWQNAGATGFSGDFAVGNPRILFNRHANRWVATSFGGDISFVNIAVSDTADATGPWKASTFVAFNGAAGNGIADLPTLAMDRNAIYIGTNDFDRGFQGSTLNVIPLSDVFGAGAPVVSNRATFATRAPFDPDFGLSLHGANSDSAGSTGWVIGETILVDGGVVGFKVANAALGAGGAIATGRVEVALQADVVRNEDARQPDGSRTLETFDSRTSGGVHEFDGKLYFTRTVTTDGQDYTVIRVTVLDASDFSVVQQFDIDDGDFDHYFGSIAVNQFGAVVNYNRSGFDPVTGNISILANAYTLDGNGLLVLDANYLLKASDNSGYRQGSLFNRWGQYSQVSIDPTDPRKFWSINNYAGFRDNQGNDGWATWISEISFASDVAAVPEPQSWAMMIVGFGVIGIAARRRRSQLGLAG